MLPPDMAGNMWSRSRSTGRGSAVSRARLVLESMGLLTSSYNRRQCRGRRLARH